MKVKDITLQVNGREMTFSEEQLTAILEKHFSEETAETAKAEKKTKAKAKPIEGKCFEVNPMEIDRSLFQKKRSDSTQECIRKYILEAFDEVDKHPEKYSKSFKTLIPERTWDGYQIAIEQKEYAAKVGDHMADWVEQVLEWAQRIANGETWKEICNDPDTANWYRLVVGKNGYCQFAGGSRRCGSNCAAASFGVDHDDRSNGYASAVPLIVLKS